MNSNAHLADVGAAKPGSLFSRLRSYFFFVPVVYLYTFVMGTLSLLCSLFDRSGRVQHWFARTWSRMILATLGIHVHMQGFERIDPGQRAVYAANHLSALDIPVLYATLPVQFRIMAKKELFRYPFLGWHLKRSGQIPIDPGDARASVRSLNRASESLRHGTPLMVFPEGGRSPSGHLQEFMGGAFYVAIRAQAPVVPLTLVGTGELVPMNSFHARPGQVELIVGEPISTLGMKVRDMDKLAKQAHDVIEQDYYAHANGESSPAGQGSRDAEDPGLSQASDADPSEAKASL